MCKAFQHTVYPRGILMASKYMKSIEPQELSWKCQTLLPLLAIIKFGNPVLVILLSSKNSRIECPLFIYLFL